LFWISYFKGVGSAEGKIVFVTTNHEAKLDPALLRSGRIDKEYKIDYADKDEILDMYLFYFPDKLKKVSVFLLSFYLYFVCLLFDLLDIRASNSEIVLREIKSQQQKFKIIS
jgi:SpoVK/Ycf46/Vps4 family AAA+-type ATPase